MLHSLPNPEELSSLKEGILPIMKRPRRNRSTPSWRALVAETHLLPQHLVYPLFVTDEKHTVPISSMPGISRFPIPELLREVSSARRLGIQSFVLFCHIDETTKDETGSSAYQPTGILPRAISALKEEFPDILLMADIALDPFTSHGQDGLVDESGHILNDPTLVALAHMSLRAAEAGVDLIAPSDMMDGRIAFLRNVLDSHQFSHVGIMSYAVKFHSSLYAPFREALGSSPKKGDKATFQVNPANAREALMECSMDEQEAADMLLIKPAAFALDIIAKVRSHTLLPLGAYQVSGEYAMIKAAAHCGWIDGNRVLMESLISMRRAGADFIFTYAAKEAAALLQSAGN
jgi:porphobilinogen synthase